MNKFELIQLQENAYQMGVAKERKRITDAIQAQIEIIKDGINNTKSELMRQAWAIAAIELVEMINIINNPITERKNAKTK